MVCVKPFKGVRPTKELVEKVASPPYDVLDSKEARDLVSENEYSFLHVVKPEIDLPVDINLYDEKVYLKGSENLNNLINNKTLIQDEKPSFYIYEQVWHGHSQTGLVACVSCEEYDNDLIKKHEHTREDKEIDRSKHIKTLNANTGPVFLMYKNKQEIIDYIEDCKKSDPEYSFEAESVKHLFWIINDQDVLNKIEEMFKEIDLLYVADGHHRSASAARVARELKENNPNHTGNEEYNFFLSVIFPDNQLKILDYNRVVKDLNGLTIEEFLNKVAEKFEIFEYKSVHNLQFKPVQTQEFGMYIDNKWYCLKAKDGIFDSNNPVKSLDVSILQENLLDPILGIKNPRKDNRIKFVGGIRGLSELEKLVKSGDFKVSFSMYPTTIEQLLNVADSNNVMPPKSTWFEPKLRSGIVLHLLK